MLFSHNKVQIISINEYYTAYSFMTFMFLTFSKGDFEEFVTHMQGLLSIYSLHGDK